MRVERMEGSDGRMSGRGRERKHEKNERNKHQTERINKSRGIWSFTRILLREGKIGRQNNQVRVKRTGALG